MTLPWRPSFSYGVGPTTFRLAWPVERWRPVLEGIGGLRMTADGTVGAWRQADRSRLALALRFMPDEWPALVGLLAWAQSGAAFDWTPDPDAPSDTFEVYLDAPRAGETVAPIADASYPRLRYLSIVIRRADGADFGLEYFAL